jgi:hypothetical protein
MFVDMRMSNVVGTYSGAVVSLEGCSFSNNSVDATSVRAGVVAVDAQLKYKATELRLQGCTFSGNSPLAVPLLAADHRETPTAVIYSDSALPAVCTYEGPLWDSPNPLPCQNSSTPEPLEKAGDNFPTASEAWLEKVKQVRSACAIGCSSN